MSRKRIFQFVKHPGEGLDAFLRRNRIHPEDEENHREATPEEEALSDKTEEYLGQAFVLTGIGGPQRPTKKRSQD